MQAKDGVGNIGMKAVKVTVTNMEEGRDGNPVAPPAEGWGRDNGQRYRP